jgi:hypothetical protein
MASKVPTHVHLFLYRVDAPGRAGYVRFDALVIGSKQENEDDQFPLLNVVYFDHLNKNAHHSLQGVDWADTCDRVLDVPHESKQENQAFYWEDPFARSNQVIRDMNAGIAILNKQLAEKDAHIKTLTAKPSGDDLDKVAAEDAAKKSTTKAKDKDAEEDKK